MDTGRQWTEHERRARELFDASVDGLDAETRSQLNRAPQAALAAAAQADRHPWRTWLPVAAAASLALLAVALWRAPGEGSAPAVRAGQGAPPAELVEMLATGDDLELADEDPEFYTWLADRGLPEGNGTG